MTCRSAMSQGTNPKGPLREKLISLSKLGGDSEMLSFIRAVTEGMALLVGLLAIETLFLGRGAYAALDVHPFWLPVILVSVQHGLYGGAATAALAFWLMDWPPRPPGVDISTYNLAMARLPIQWLLYALLIGLYRQAERRRQAAQRSEIEILRERNRVFADEIRRIDQELWRFEVAAATDSVWPSHLPQSAASGRTVDVDDELRPIRGERSIRQYDLAHAVVRSLSTALGVKEAQLFVRNIDGRYVGASEADPCPLLGHVLDADHPIVQGVLELQNPAFIDDGRSNQGAIAAVAFPNSDARALKGLITIPCSRDDTTRASALTALADASAALLSRMEDIVSNDTPADIIGASA